MCFPGANRNPLRSKNTLAAARVAWTDPGWLRRDAELGFRLAPKLVEFGRGINAPLRRGNLHVPAAIRDQLSGLFDRGGGIIAPERDAARSVGSLNEEHQWRLLILESLSRLGGFVWPAQAQLKFERCATLNSPARPRDTRFIALQHPQRFPDMINIEQFQQHRKQQVDAVLASAGTVSKGVQEIVAAYTDYSKKSFEESRSYVA